MQRVGVWFFFCAVSAEAWQGRIRASAGIASLPPEEVRAFRRARLLEESFPDETLQHRIAPSLLLRRWLIEFRSF
jgi:hypothetical protein